MNILPPHINTLYIGGTIIALLSLYINTRIVTRKLQIPFKSHEEYQNRIIISKDAKSHIFLVCTFIVLTSAFTQSGIFLSCGLFMCVFNITRINGIMRIITK